MLRLIVGSVVALIASAALALPAAATPNCFRGEQPYRMAGDTVHWAMRIAPGAECIQGLRWSTMQIENVAIATPPGNGTILMVGNGFRYFANPQSPTATDHFTLVVTGKNRHDHGTSTVDIIVGRPLGYMVGSMIEWCDGCRTWASDTAEGS